MKQLLSIARKTILAAFDNKNYNIPPIHKKKLQHTYGVLVNLYRDGELRGSYGYPPGELKLADGIKRAARGAAFMDRRFRPLTREEFSQVKLEVVIITSVKELTVKRSRLFKSIDPKKDGILISYGPYTTLQIPSFAQEFGFKSREYVETTLQKVGLAPEVLSSPSCKIYTFTPHVLRE